MTERVFDIVEPVLTMMNYELVDVTYKKEDDNMVLDIIIDKEDGGISLVDCEDVSHALDPVLDDADPISDPYCLCVSSPGADREIKTEKDYLRNIEKDVEVRLYKAINKKSKHIGVLKSFDDTNITLTEKDKSRQFEVLIPREVISVIRQYVKF